MYIDYLFLLSRVFLFTSYIFELGGAVNHSVKVCDVEEHNYDENEYQGEIHKDSRTDI